MGSAVPVDDPCAVDFPLLISYHYFRSWSDEDKAKILSGSVNARGFSLMLDSGAFSAKTLGVEINLDEYMAFLHKHGDVFTGAMSHSMFWATQGQPKRTWTRCMPRA